MQRVTVTIDRVFDITTGVSRGKQPCTFFSFQSGQSSEYGVAVPGEPRLVSGMTVSAVLDEDDNWQSLLGWIDHGTGELVCWSRGSNVIVFLLSLPATGALVVASQQSPKISAVGLLALAFFLFMTIREYSVLSKARHALENIKSCEMRLH